MPPKKILIVDDELEVTDFLKEYLQGKGLEVLTASDGKTGLETALEKKPALILLDIRMGEGLSGIEVLRRVRGKLQSPVIMVTAADDKNVFDLAKGLGAADYITKPFVLEELERVILSRLVPPGTVPPGTVSGSAGFGA